MPVWKSQTKLPPALAGSLQATFFVWVQESKVGLGAPQNWKAQCPAEWEAAAAGWDTVRAGSAQKWEFLLS